MRAWLSAVAWSCLSVARSPCFLCATFGLCCRYVAKQELVLSWLWKEFELEGPFWDLLALVVLPWFLGVIGAMSNYFRGLSAEPAYRQVAKAARNAVREVRDRFIQLIK